MSSIALQLPKNYVEVEREEMEYVDGGRNYKEYWWGQAVDLSPSECAAASDALSKSANICTKAAIAAGIGGFLTGYAIPVGIALEVYATQLTDAAIDLNTASRRRGATLCNNALSKQITVNIW